MKPGIYDTPADAYHADPGDRPSLSSSIINIMLNQSPRHAWAAHPRLNPAFVKTEDEKFDVGTVAHALLLEGEAAVEIIDAPDWRTKSAKEARDLARAHGRVPLLGHQYDSVKAMVDSVAVQLAAFDADPVPLTGGKPEQTLVWEESGVLCRARVDWLHDEVAVIDDLKTTTRSAHPEAFSRTLYGIGCDVQAAFYLRGLKELDGREALWRWIVVETTPPYALSVITPGPDILTLANAKIDRALALWRNCLATDEWPAYPNRVVTAELPGWEEARWLAREEVNA